jgi:hypothetical protein
MLGSKHRSKGPHEWLAEYHLADCHLAYCRFTASCHIVIWHRDILLIVIRLIAMWMSIICLFFICLIVFWHIAI